MKEFFKMFFASILAMVIGGVLLIFIFIGIIAGLAKSVTEKKKPEIAGNVLKIDLTKRIHEMGETNPLAAIDNGAGYDALSIKLIEEINRKYPDFYSAEN